MVSRGERAVAQEEPVAAHVVEVDAHDLAAVVDVGGLGRHAVSGHRSSVAAPLSNRKPWNCSTRIDVDADHLAAVVDAVDHRECWRLAHRWS